MKNNGFALKAGREKVRSSSERTIERRVSPQPQGYEANQRTTDEEEEGKEKEEKRGEEEEERFSPSSSCALPPSIRSENVSTLTTPRTTDRSTKAGDLSLVERNLEENQESPVEKGRVLSSKESGAAAKVAGGGATAGASEVVLGGEGAGLNERCKDIPRPATASSGGNIFLRPP